jgi:hypothetical protein
MDFSNGNLSPSSTNNQENNVNEATHMSPSKLNPTASVFQPNTNAFVFQPSRPTGRQPLAQHSAGGPPVWPSAGWKLNPTASVFQPFQPTGWPPAVHGDPRHAPPTHGDPRLALAAHAPTHGDPRLDPRLAAPTHGDQATATYATAVVSVPQQDGVVELLGAVMNRLSGLESQLRTTLQGTPTTRRTVEELHPDIQRILDEELPRAADVRNKDRAGTQKWLQAISFYNSVIAKTKDPAAPADAFKKHSPDMIVASATGYYMKAPNGTDNRAASRRSCLQSIVSLMKYLKLTVSAPVDEFCKEVLKMLKKEETKDIATGHSNANVSISFMDTRHLINSSMMANYGSK